MPRTLTNPETQIEVEVLEYDSPEGPGGFSIYGPGEALVFHGERLLYALLRTRPGERSRPEIESRHGELPEESRTCHVTVCIVESFAVLSYPERRAAFVACETREGIGPFYRKIVWAGSADGPDDPAGIEWRIPAAGER